MPSPPRGLEKSIEFIRSNIHIQPRLALVLGSGLGDLAETFTGSTILDTRTIPHYPISTIEGHKGKLVFATYASLPLVAFQGRLHFYESNDLEAVLYPVRIAKALGVETLIVTNAAGGINPDYQPGDLMLLADQINLTGEEVFEKSDQRKVGNSIYDKSLIELIQTISRNKSIPLWVGIYGGVKGPSYETAAEVQMVGKLGGDAVGMSTVLETSLASALGMRVAGVSCITNKATGISPHKLSHDEVTVAANRAKKDFARLILGIIEELAREEA
jgi:purine-nucleoside phosphorylase